MRQWINFLKIGRTNIHDEESSTPSVVSDEIFHKIDEKVYEN